jgi:DNA transformation protein
MAFDQGLFALVQESLEPLGPVTLRKMMGGATLYLDGTVFAILYDEGIWFKADKQSDAEWDAAGALRVTYDKGDGQTGTMNYRHAPADVYDDPEEMQRWAKLALEAGLRGGEKKRSRQAKT